MDNLFLGVMELQEAKNHELGLKSQGVDLILKVNPQTCTTGCKVTVEVWCGPTHAEAVQKYFQNDYLKHVRGHVPDFAQLAQVFDPSLSEVICQACGSKFSPLVNECPDCGLVY